MIMAKPNTKFTSIQIINPNDTKNKKKNANIDAISNAPSVI